MSVTRCDADFQGACPFCENENDEDGDIVHRLRFQHVMVGSAMGRWLNADTANPLCNEAASEIEKLRCRVAELLFYLTAYPGERPR